MGWGKTGLKENIAEQGNWSLLDPQHSHIPIISPRPWERSFWSPAQFPEVKGLFEVRTPSLMELMLVELMYSEKWNSPMQLCQHPLAAAGTLFLSARSWQQ